MLRVRDEFAVSIHLFIGFCAFIIAFIIELLGLLHNGLDVDMHFVRECDIVRERLGFYLEERSYALDLFYQLGFCSMVDVLQRLVIRKAPHQLSQRTQNKIHVEFHVHNRVLWRTPIFWRVIYFLRRVIRRIPN